MHDHKLLKVKRMHIYYEYKVEYEYGIDYGITLIGSNVWKDGEERSISSHTKLHIFDSSI
jgi:hypothetical protein